MARGKRTDVNAKAKVISSKIANIDKTLEEIGSETGLPKSTVADILENDLPEVRKSSEIIASIIENDLESIKNMSEITKRFTEQIKRKENLERADIDTANRTTDSAFKRSQLLQDKPTEKVDFDISDEQKKIIAARFLGIRT